MINEFSYEDIGSLSLYLQLFVGFGILFGLMLKSFIQFYKLEKSWMAPHPFVVVSLAFQVLGIFLQLLHQWLYSSDGEGSIPIDVTSKVLETFSESIMSLLLILLASGWKMHF